MTLKIMLTTMDVTIGKYIVVFPFLNVISPGSLPITVQINPMIMKSKPIKINNFPKLKFHEPPD